MTAWSVWLKHHQMLSILSGDALPACGFLNFHLYKSVFHYDKQQQHTPEVNNSLEWRCNAESYLIPATYKRTWLVTKSPANPLLLNLMVSWNGVWWLNKRCCNFDMLNVWYKFKTVEDGGKSQKKSICPKHYGGNHIYSLMHVTFSCYVWSFWLSNVNTITFQGA